ncbi:unnamed protein product [Urochloa decumbens]|uniref:Uncharacterized protein n=1 Tax=Urochloa decumbens TaxID=240449 RepID=A0ABC9BQF2_9POAL
MPYHHVTARELPGPSRTLLDSTQLSRAVRNPWDTPMDETNHADQSPPPASAPASSPPTSVHDPAGVAPDQDPTQLLTKLFAGATLTVPTDDAPDRIHQTPPAAPGHDPDVTSDSAGGPIARILRSMMAKGSAPLATPPLNTFAPPASFPMAAGHDPGAASHRDAIIELLAKLVGEGEPTTPMRPVPVPVAPPLRNRAAVRAIIRERAILAAGGGGVGVGATESAARRREGRRLFSVPSDYLRAGQESRERRRRRAVVRRNVRVLLSIHEDRTSERGLSAMMARLATTVEPVAPAAGDGSVSAVREDAAAPSSTEHDELGELMDKMELSFKD